MPAALNKYLVKHKWKKVRGINRYRDPKTGKLYAMAHAEIVQRGYESKAQGMTKLKAELKAMADAKAAFEWDPGLERIDELFPPGSVYKKKKNSGLT